MKLAFVCAQGVGETDRLLSQAADWATAQGLHPRGLVKVQKPAPPDGHSCDMDLCVLPDGPAIRITQSLGEGSAGCRLDPGAIATAVAEVEKAGFEGADIFFLNKFGPEEAAGRGFCNVIGAALEHDIPVLVGVGRVNRAAFEDFAGGLAKPLAADTIAIRNWCRSG